MAEMKLRELAQALGKDDKEIKDFLAAHNIEAKQWNSKVTAEGVELAQKEFAAKPAETAKTAAAKEEKAAEAPQMAETPKANEGSKAAGAPKGQAQNDRPKPGEKHGPQGQVPKKKKIIMVGVGNANGQNRPSGSRPGQNNNQNRYNNGNDNGRRDDRPHNIIKPRVAPSPTPSVDMRKPVQPVKKTSPAPAPVEEVKAAPVAEAKAVANNENRQQPKQNANQNSFDNRNERNNDRNNERNNDRNNRNNNKNFDKNTRNDERNDGRNQERNQKNNNNNDSRRDNGNRNGGPSNNGRPDRGNGRPGNQAGGKGFAQEVPANNNQSGKKDKRKDKDNRSKKDAIYEDENIRRGKNGKKVGAFVKPEKKVEAVVEEEIKTITLPESLTIKDLADKMRLQPAAIIKKLFLQGKIVTVNQEISYEEAEEIAIEYDIICEQEEKVDVIEELLKEDEEAEDEMITRPPVICVMGHVDHGKTSLLDAIRKTNVTDREAGGITQHIGAYSVTLNNQKITFLDTPGHEAFTAMRMRGANSTDIAILVVAADDGVMPQTVEAINHAKAAGIEIIVAVNKIDKPNANIERVKQELTEYELIPVDWGGTTEFVPVSAKSGEGIDDLLETILLTAEILELKANPNRAARGLVIEAQLDKGRGPVATVLVQKGTLHVGDFVSAGASYGKVRAMIDDKGRRVKEATPSTPVEILGLSDVPGAGEIIVSHKSDKEAKSFAETYMAQNKEKKLEETKTKMSLDDVFAQIQEGNLKELNLIVKADVQGSVEAVKSSLLKLSNEEVVVKCIHGGVGAINESDVVLASASNAIIIGFNIRPDATAKATADREGVDIRLYKVIYQAIEDIEAAMKGMLDPIFEEKIIGHAEVRQIFKASQVGNIAGSYILDGEFKRDCLIRITREGEQIYEGKLASLKRFKDDVKEVKAGFECGLVFEDFDRMQEFDIVEAYIMVEVPR